MWLEMSDSVGFLLSDSSRLLRRRFDQYARAIGVTRPQWQVLFALSRLEGTNQGSLAEHLEVEAITLCRMLDRLQEADLVERRADPADRRAWRLFLTDKARPLLDSMRAIGDRVLEEALAGIDAPARAALAESLGRIRLNLTTRPADDGALGKEAR
jgi:DNA-binding MarR family transcriptional regulator